MHAAREQSSTVFLPPLNAGTASVLIMQGPPGSGGEGEPECEEPSSADFVPKQTFVRECRALIESARAGLQQLEDARSRSACRLVGATLGVLGWDQCKTCRAERWPTCT